MEVSWTFILAYLLGGFTFIPLLLVLCICHVYIRMPHLTTRLDGNIELHDGPEKTLDDLTKEEDSKDESSPVSGCYFAVSREYIPALASTKPPDSPAQTGDTIASESPSVYQSMYRSIFDRSKGGTSGTTDHGKAAKRTRNTFYVILRHGHLLLFDNAEQLEVRQVIVLAHYDIDLYGGGAAIPEGELFVKRNCIRLVRKSSDKGTSTAPKPYFLFSDNSSDKEDFYHAMILQRYVNASKTDNRLRVQVFEPEDMVSLIRNLHNGVDSGHMRWLNAILGRIFLATYKTSYLGSMIRQKIVRKISRVQKPSFIPKIELRSVDLGNAAPTFSAFKMKEMTVDGTCIVETDVAYAGNFKIILAATARLDFGPRFKVREVQLLLVGILRKLQGHLLLKVKPPPSNRLWLSFENPPLLDLAFEPIVSTRQIKYGIVLRAIETKVKEILNDTLVFPNWDDVPFTDTELESIRGGLWHHTETTKSSDVQDTLVSETEKMEVKAKDIKDPVSRVSRTREDDDRLSSELKDSSKGQSINALLSEDSSLSSNPLSTSPPGIRTPPKSLRSHSFAAAASPVLSTGRVTSDMSVKSVPLSKHDAAKKMKLLSATCASTNEINNDGPIKSSGRLSTDADEISVLADDTLPDTDSVGSIKPSIEISATSKPPSTLSTSSSNPSMNDASLSRHLEEPFGHSRTTSAEALEGNVGLASDRRAALNQSLTSARLTAKRWSQAMINKSNTWKARDVSRNVPPSSNGPVSEMEKDQLAATISEPEGLPRSGLTNASPDPRNIRRKPLPQDLLVAAEKSPIASDGDAIAPQDLPLATEDPDSNIPILDNYDDSSIHPDEPVAIDGSLPKLDMSNSDSPLQADSGSEPPPLKKPERLTSGLD